MGLDINAVQFLIAARQEGVELGDVLTLGRQDLNVYPARMRAILDKHRFPSQAFAPDVAETGYAEPVFKALGAKNVFALDASNFEGADFVHDLNQPLPPELKERFDLVYDGGTLEHVFNFPVALKNCMEMLRPGGRFFTHAGTNNWCGHGFYQFSPELYFRVFSEENGFAIERMVAHRVGPYRPMVRSGEPERHSFAGGSDYVHTIATAGARATGQGVAHLRCDAATERLHPALERGCGRSGGQRLDEPIRAGSPEARAFFAGNLSPAARDEDWNLDLSLILSAQSQALSSRGAAVKN